MKSLRTSRKEGGRNPLRTSKKEGGRNKVAHEILKDSGDGCFFGVTCCWHSAFGS